MILGPRIRLGFQIMSVSGLIAMNEDGLRSVSFFWTCKLEKLDDKKTRSTFVCGIHKMDCGLVTANVAGRKPNIAL